MQMPNDEQRRTSALAYWRYAHEYLRAARSLAGRHRLPSDECQPIYHLLAQALEFGCKAFLRARGVPASEVTREYGCAVQRAFDACRDRGLAAPPAEVTRVVQMLGARHTRDAFRSLREGAEGFPDFAPLFEAMHWLLSAIIAPVAEDYVTHYGADASPSTEAFIARLRADLCATQSESAVPA